MNLNLNKSISEGMFLSQHWELLSGVMFPSAAYHGK